MYLHFFVRQNRLNPIMQRAKIDRSVRRALPEERSRMRALDWAHAGIKTAQLNDSSRSPNILFSIFFQFLMGSVMDINKLYPYITTFNLINITITNIAINTGRLWRRPVLGQSEIVCTVAVLDVQCDTAINLCRAGERSRSRGVRSIARSHCWTTMERTLYRLSYWGRLKEQTVISAKRRLRPLRSARLFPQYSESLLNTGS